MNSIPKTFWYAASLSMVMATAGLLYIANKSASVSVEFADIKIRLQQAITKAEELKRKLETDYSTLEEKEERIEAQSSALQRAYSESPADIQGEISSELLQHFEAFEIDTPEVEVPREAFEELQTELEAIKKSLGPGL